MNALGHQGRLQITYAPETIAVTNLIETIEQTPHMMVGLGMKYTAKVKP